MSTCEGTFIDYKMPHFQRDFTPLQKPFTKKHRSCRVVVVAYLVLANLLLACIQLLRQTKTETPRVVDNVALT